MNSTNSRYTRFALCREMLETVDVIRNLDMKKIKNQASMIKKKVLLSGEGSSRIFPAKNTLYNSARLEYGQIITTEGATQALEYKLDDHTVFVASNSGRTKEGVRLIRKLKEQGHQSVAGIVANEGTPIIEETDFGYTLSCGKEEAVAATKSVMEQALYYDILFRELNNLPQPDLNKLADCVEQALTFEIPESVLAPLVDAPLLYWGGRNTGVAEELRLKTNEITRKKSDYLEGTYAAHGIEEVMNANEALILVSPFKEEEAKLTEVLVQGVGLSLVAISTEKTSFPTFIIPDCGDFTTYVELAAGWESHG
jgi:glucosamine--fructose-6-phosphate aminotransferase (isomerizing)